MINDNLQIIESTLKNELMSEWSKINFEYTFEENYFKATATITLNTCDDDIFLSLAFWGTGIYRCVAIFDKIELSLPVARYINKLVCDENIEDNLMIYIDEDDYLTVSRMGALYDCNNCGDIASDFIISFINLTEKPEFKVLTDFTQ